MHKSEIAFATASVNILCFLHLTSNRLNTRRGMKYLQNSNARVKFIYSFKITKGKTKIILYCAFLIRASICFVISCWFSTEWKHEEKTLFLTLSWGISWRVNPIECVINRHRYSWLSSDSFPLSWRHHRLLIFHLFATLARSRVFLTSCKGSIPVFKYSWGVLWTSSRQVNVTTNWMKIVRTNWITNSRCFFSCDAISLCFLQVFTKNLFCSWCI